MVTSSIAILSYDYDIDQHIVVKSAAVADSRWPSAILPPASNRVTVGPLSAHGLPLRAVRQGLPKPTASLVFEKPITGNCRLVNGNSPRSGARLAMISCGGDSQLL
jgi:hypothetical protein